VLENLTMSLLYLLLALVIGAKERRRMSISGVDTVTIIVIFAFFYIIIPSIVIHWIIGVYEGNIKTNIFFFDKVLLRISFFDSLTIFLLTSMFLFGFYTFSRDQNFVFVEQKNHTLSINQNIALLFSAILFLICMKFYFDLGGSFSERYSQLVKFRSLDFQSDRNFFTANAFSLTRTLTWLSAAMFYVSLSRRHKLLTVLYFVLMIIGVFLTGSRREIIFAFLIVYFSFILYGKRLKILRIVWFIPLFIIWIAFGKEFAWSNAYAARTDLVFSQYDSIDSLVLRAFCDIGITQISSFAVLQHFDITLRLGVDHILSVLRRLPDGMLGLDIEWPKRIVRVTTENFTSRHDADIAPGLIGQSWFDFPVLGAFLWGALLGFQIRFLTRWSSRYNNTPEKNALIVLLCLIIAMPINTGSFDFTFSIDMIVLVFALAMIFRTAHPGSPVTARG
jgi:hypothetical protein